MKMALLMWICIICLQWTLNLVTAGRTGLNPTPDMICPVTDSCSIKRADSNPMLHINTKKTPCCSTCSCDDSCSEIGNCCPSRDIGIPVESTNYKFFCTSTRYDYYNKTVEISTFGVGETYQMITTCLEGYEHDITTENKCVNSTESMPESYDDIVVVSSTDDHDLIFRNKYCAECNGVKQVERWELVVGYCSPTMLYETTLTGLDLYQYIITNCDVSSKPSADVKLTNIAICSSALIAVCNKTNIWGLYGSNIKVDSGDVYSTNNHKIARGRVEMNGHYFCCDCNTTEDMFSKNVCPLNTTDSAGEPNISTPLPFMATLDTSLELSNQEKHQGLTGRCAFNEIYSEMEGLCRRVYCPVNSSPYNGRCQANSLDMTGLAVHVRLIIIPTETIPMEWIYIQKLIHVAENFLTYFNVFGCGVCSTVGYLTQISDEKTNDFMQSMTFEFKIDVDSKCKLGTIETVLRQFAVNSLFHIETKQVPANVDIVYFDMDIPTNYSDYLNSTNMYEFMNVAPTRCGKSLKLNPVFFCPYVEFTEEEYTSLLKAAQSAKYTPRDVSDIYNSNVTTIDSQIFHLTTINGQPRHYVTCIENILHKALNNCARLQSPLSFIVLVTIVSYTRYGNYYHFF